MWQEVQSKCEMNRQLQKVHSDEDDYSKRNFMENNSEETFKNRSCSKNLQLLNKPLVEDGFLCCSCGFTTPESKTFKRHVDGVHIIGLTNCTQFGYSSLKADTFSGMYILPEDLIFCPQNFGGTNILP